MHLLIAAEQGPGARRRSFVGALLGAACMAALLVLPGCSKDSPDALLASAKDYAAKGDHNAAVIQLRNALQQAPANGEARFLLGRELLQMRDPVSAEKELRRAQELKVAEDRVLPELAQAQLESRAFDTLIREFGARNFSNAAVESRVRAYVGEAYLATGDLARAAQAFDAALRATAEFPPALLGQSRLALRENRLDDANALADRVLKAAPATTDALLVKADAALGAGDRERAKALLRQVVQADPKSLFGHFGLISLSLDENALDAAAAELDAARKVARGDVRLAYFDGLLAFRRGDLNKAREHALQILKVSPDHVPTLVLLGGVELQAGQIASAEDRLRRALNKAPAHTVARRLLVATLLRSGQPARALEALQPLMGEGLASAPPVLLLAGETYLANGDLNKASAYFEKASGTDGQSVAARTRLGQIALARGHAEEGIRELEAAAGADAKDNQADIALVLSHLKRKDGAKALAAARALTKKQPNNPVSFQVLGGVQLALKDVIGARASFEQALGVAPTFLPAAFSLANLDLADKKADAARKRLAALHEKDPKNEQIILAQAEVEARTGAPAKDIQALIQKAIAANPQSPTARIALTTHYLANKDPRAAVTAAQDASAALPKDPRMLEMLSVAQEAAGEAALAADSLNRLAQLRPGVAEPLLRLAALSARAGDTDRAIETLQRAQKVAPDNRQIDRDLVALLITKGKTDLALKQARDLQARAPTFGGGLVLEGDVFMTQKKFVEAERAYRGALKLEPASGQVASKVAASLYASGKNADADAFTRKWLADNPKDVQLRLVLADRSMRARDLPKAAELYQALLAVDSNNVVALNNLAWIGGETGDAKALAYAERAAKLAPQNASVLETLGTLLLKRGDTARAQDVLNQARTLAPNRVDVRLSYARALAAGGKKDEARALLREIAETKEDVAEKRAAAELLQKL